MPTLSGVYMSFSGCSLTIDGRGQLTLAGQGQPGGETTKLRADAEFWLCEDDGNIGKFGTPTKVTLQLEGKPYHLWVEPRGFSGGVYEYGLIPIEPHGEYSNRFLAINEKLDGLEILDEWVDRAKFRCVEG